MDFIIREALQREIEESTAREQRVADQGARQALQPSCQPQKNGEPDKERQDQTQQAAARRAEEAERLRNQRILEQQKRRAKEKELQEQQLALAVANAQRKRTAKWYRALVG